VLHHPDRTHHLEAMAATHHPEAMVLHLLARILLPEAIHLTELQGTSSSRSSVLLVVIQVNPINSNVLIHSGAFGAGYPGAPGMPGMPGAVPGAPGMAGMPGVPGKLLSFALFD